MIDIILVPRLVEFYDPWGGLFDRRPTAAEVARARVRPVPLLLRGHRTRAYDLGRVRFFRDELCAGRMCEPLEVDNYCQDTHIYGPFVVDGHHRLCGALLAGQLTLPVHYSGRVDTLRYLRGQRRTPPRDL